MNRIETPYFWDSRYVKPGNPGWDVGYAVPALTNYIDQLTNKQIRILVPGGGFGYEVRYLFQKGFHQVYYLDFSIEAIMAFKSKYPDFPGKNIIHDNFFLHQGSYHLIIEHTFFCSLPKVLRPEFARKCHQLLMENGKLCGLLFNHEFNNDNPPFGGNEDEYIALFRNCFNFLTFEKCYNSIKPRANRELFFILIRKSCFNEKQSFI